MKQALIILGVLMIFSFQSIDGRQVYKQSTNKWCYPIPLKQKKVVVTEQESLMKKYIKYGWICSDVDIVVHRTNETTKYYTLIKY